MLVNLLFIGKEHDPHLLLTLCSAEMPLLLPLLLLLLLVFQLLEEEWIQPHFQRASPLLVQHAHDVWQLGR